MSTSNSITIALEKVAMDRIDYVSRENIKELDKQNEVIKNIRYKLKENLSDEQASLLGELEDAINMYSGIFELKLYLQGLKDGSELSSFLSF